MSVAQVFVSSCQWRCWRRLRSSIRLTQVLYGPGQSSAVGCGSGYYYLSVCVKTETLTLYNFLINASVVTVECFSPS